MRFFTLAIALVLGGAASLRAEADAPAFEVVASLHHGKALDRAHDVELQGDHAFVPGKGGSLATVDVGRPAAPEIAWFRHDSGAIDNAETVLPHDGWLFLGTDAFHAVDVTNAKRPTFEGKVAGPRVDRINGMVRRGDLVLAANKSGWLAAFDVSEPSEPSLFGARNVRKRDGLRAPHDIGRLGDSVILVDPRRFGREKEPGKLAVIRVFDDGEPVPTPRWTFQGVEATQALMGANRVAVAGDFAFVGGSSPGEGLGTTYLTVVDLESPQNPRQVAAVGFAERFGHYGLTVAGDVVFAAGGRTLDAVDVSDPSEPEKLASRQFPEALPTRRGNLHDLVYRGGHLYVSAQKDDRLLVIRVADERIRRKAERENGS